ncbi:hypothetical protein QOZ80_7BG0598510 [Eleusine coracana subsp. coracana]|nr:hypothetical protein QOZ80_7BG0598510 [Eleusine coracana subsp. coracana]
MISELTAILQALLFARSRGIDRLIVETDAVNVRLALSTQGYDLASCCMIIRDIKTLLSTEFQHYRVEYQPRKCNAAANRLAQFGCELELGHVMVWPDGHPAIVNCFIAADLQPASG